MQAQVLPDAKHAVRGGQRDASVATTGAGSSGSGVRRWASELSRADGLAKVTQAQAKRGTIANGLYLVAYDVALRGGCGWSLAHA